MTILLTYCNSCNRFQNPMLVSVYDLFYPLTVILSNLSQITDSSGIFASIL